MANSSKLGVPLIAADQSQKHVTANDTFTRFDQMVQQTVINRTTTAPPGSPSEGHAYIIAATATGDWSGRETQIAAYITGSWVYLTPREGWIVYDESTGEHLKFNGTAWVGLFTTGSDTWGWQNFQHTGGAVTLTAADTWYDLTNDALGALTSTAYKVTGHGTIWNSTTNRLDVSDLSIGDRVHTRIDLTPTAAGVNNEFQFRLLLQEGVLDIPIGAGPPAFYKSSGTHDPITLEPSFTIFNAGTRDNPVAIQAKSDTAGASIQLSGFTIETRVR